MTKKMNCLGFEVKRSKLKVTARSHKKHFWEAFSHRSASVIRGRTLF